MSLFFWDWRSLENSQVFSLNRKLPKSDFERLENISAEKRKLEFITGRFLLRKILNQWNNKILYTKSGKPFFPDTRHFSLSHSHRISILGLSNNPIGVDVQADDGREIQHFIDQFANEGEKRQLEYLNQSSQRDFFFKTWSQKEAYAKLFGQGLSVTLTELSFNDGKSEDSQVFEKNWQTENYYLSACSLENLNYLNPPTIFQPEINDYHHSKHHHQLQM